MRLEYRDAADAFANSPSDESRAGAHLNAGIKTSFTAGATTAVLEDILGALTEAVGTPPSAALR